VAGGGLGATKGIVSDRTIISPDNTRVCHPTSHRGPNAFHRAGHLAPLADGHFALRHGANRATGPTGVSSDEGHWYLLGLPSESPPESRRRRTKLHHSISTLIATQADTFPNDGIYTTTLQLATRLTLLGTESATQSRTRPVEGFSPPRCTGGPLKLNKLHQGTF
jgi:hypothetical protein